MKTLFKTLTLFLTLFITTLMAYEATPSIPKKYVVIKEQGVTINVAYPKFIARDQYFTMEVSMTNNVNFATRGGGVTLSFPKMQALESKIIYDTFQETKVYDPYSRIYNRVTQKSMSSYDYMIEAWEDQWRVRGTKRISLRVKAPNAKLLTINIRGILRFSNSEIHIPQKAKEKDQQGYSVKQISIDII